MNILVGLAGRVDLNHQRIINRDFRQLHNFGTLRRRKQTGLNGGRQLFQNLMNRFRQSQLEHLISFIQNDHP